MAGQGGLASACPVTADLPYPQIWANGSLGDLSQIPSTTKRLWHQTCRASRNEPMLCHDRLRLALAPWRSPGLLRPLDKDHSKLSQEQQPGTEVTRVRPGVCGTSRYLISLNSAQTSPHRRQRPGKKEHVVRRTQDAGRRSQVAGRRS
ncbi:uncharacterized protein PG986_005519 [Apiospora aurea]|uniref:Uncharacterized protein n=1 Tax=Apiospora aurea TaxID=335848 RepID=A0ABR1QHT0_9PEZI